eukprot:m.183317 g.183317  ORF g.183317 m.183317 type:complete len:833 (-) comp17474_c0_seq1:868-3366(-)
MEMSATEEAKGAPVEELLGSNRDTTTTTTTGNNSSNNINNNAQSIDSPGTDSGSLGTPRGSLSVPVRQGSEQSSDAVPASPFTPLPSADGAPLLLHNGDEFSRGTPASRADSESLSLRSMLRQAMDGQVESERRFARNEAALRKELDVLEKQRERWFKSSAELRRHLDNLHQENAKLVQQLSNKGLFGRLRSSNRNSVSSELDASMQQAQEMSELLRTVVFPMEEEINALKRRLRDSVPTTPGASGGDGVLSPIGLGGNIVRALETEKSARMDLDMQIQVLQTQKSVLQAELEKLQLELDAERTAHTELKLTWQRANEQFIETSMTLTRKCEQLERLLPSHLPTSNPFSSGLETGDRNGHQLTPSEQESVAYLKHQLESEKVKYQQLDRIVEAMREQHTREQKNSRETFQKQQSALESEIAAQRMQLVTFEEQITLLTERLRTKETAAPQQQGCGLCENYEKQLVLMQTQKKETMEHAEQCLELARVKEQALESGMGEQAARYHKQLKSALDDLEARLTLEYAQRVETLSNDYAATVKELQDKIVEFEQKHATLEELFEANKQKFEATCSGGVDQFAQLQTALEASNKTLVEKDVELATLRKSVQTLQSSEESLRAEFSALQADFNETSEDLEAMSQALRDRVEESKNEKLQLSREIDRLLSTNSLLQREVYTLSQRSDDILKQQNATSASAANMSGEMDGLRKEMEMLAMTRDSLQALLQTSEAHLAATQSENAALHQQLEQLSMNRQAQEDEARAQEKAFKQNSKEVILGLQRELHAAREAAGAAEARAAAFSSQLAASQRVEQELTAVMQSLQIELAHARSHDGEKLLM